jgi:vitamin B12 transporter
MNYGNAVKFGDCPRNGDSICDFRFAICDWSEISVWKVRNRFNRPKNQLREGRELRRIMRFFTILFLFSFLTINVFAQSATPTPTSAIRETVTVSAGTNQPLEDVSKTVDIVDSKQLKERSEFSLTDTLRTIPGFRVQQAGGFGRLTTIKTRGLRNQDTAVLLDGIRFRDAAAITGDASSFLSDFTNTNAFRIEVLRGSGSSLYGTNAVGGAVDIQTQEPKKGFHGGISGNFGGLGFTRFRGNISDGFDKFSYSIGVARTRFTKGIDKDDDAANTNFNGRIDYKPSYKTFISGRIYVSDAAVNLNSSPDTFGTLPTNTSTIITAKKGINFVIDANDPDALQKSNAFNGQLHFTQVFNDNLTLRTTYQGLKTNRRNSDGLLGVGFQSAYSSKFSGEIHTINSNILLKAGKYNLITAGYEYENETFVNENSDRSAVKVKQASNTFFAQNLLSLLDSKLQFSVAVRGQYFTLNQPKFTVGSNSAPNLFRNVSITNPPKSYTFDGSASYFISKTGTKFRSHVGNGYRVPSLYERFGTYFVEFFGSFFRLGNPELKPEKSIAFDGGIDQSLFNERLILRGTYFYTKINDEISYLPTDDLGGASYFNFDKHFSRGAEFSGNIKATNTTNLFASYTYTNSDVRNFRRLSFLPSPVVSTDKRSFGIPTHQFSATATQYITEKFFVNFDYLATSEYLAPIFSNATFQSYTYEFKGNRKADLTASYEFGTKRNNLKFRIYGTLENLFNYEYFENGFQTAGRFGRVGLALSF